MHAVAKLHADAMVQAVAEQSRTSAKELTASTEMMLAATAKLGEAMDRAMALRAEADVIERAARAEFIQSGNDATASVMAVSRQLHDGRVYQTKPTPGETQWAPKKEMKPFVDTAVLEGHTDRSIT